MPPRTSIFKVLPWDGGVNSSLDPSMIPPNQVVTGNNYVVGVRTSKAQRDGINHNWDNVANGTASVLCVHDYWTGNATRTQQKVAIHSDGKVYSYTNNGVATLLSDIGSAWSGTLTSASMLTFGNILLMAVSGASNTMKYWTGTGAIADVYSTYNLTSISRASSGTTRTLIFSTGFPAANGTTVVISGAGDSHYNGTFTVTSVTTTSVANDTITFTGVGSLTESTAADTGIVAGALAPKASILREHLGRVWCNDKSNCDSLLYSPTGDWTQWMGQADSGGFPIGQGDGDPVGLNGIAPTFKGALFVGKLTKLYKISGYAPEEFLVEKVSDGIGFVSHNAIAPIDQDDLFFVSEKGVHSMNATQAYGDFQSTYVSADIQKSFNESFNKSRLGFVHAAYLAPINSVGFTFSSAGVGYNDQFWLYHIPKKNWYQWPQIVCESLVVANDSDKKRFYFGTKVSRISKSFNGSNYDIDNTGAQTAIPFHLTTGNIYVDGDPYTLKAFKSFTLFYRPSGTHTINVNFTVDNYALNSENSLSFAEVSSTALVGSTFITGSSVVGSEVVLAPYTRHVDGIGRGCKIDLTQSTSNGTVEIQGFAIEWEPAGSSTEVILN